MPIFKRRDPSVEARQHFGPNLSITSFKAGDQIARDGDFLVVDAEAVAQQRAQGAATVGKGCVYVIPKAQFLKEFDAADATPIPVVFGDPPLVFDALSFDSLKAAPAPAATTEPAPAV